MKLTRLQFRPDGIFGELHDDKGTLLAYTLEHAYKLALGGWLPKLPNGKFICIRGTHKLHNNIPFETFEITGVKGHDNILFHAGNFNKDSEGCVLLGNSIVSQQNGTEMVVNSKVTFNKFMGGLVGVKEFMLTVETYA